jgi:opacity protein-like surface antigen
MLCAVLVSIRTFNNPKHRSDIGMSVSIKDRMGVAGAVAAAMLSVSGAAAAANPGIYIATDVAMDSADFNQGQFAGFIDALESDEEFDFDVEESSLDKSNAGFSLAVGYQITQNIAVEAAYLDLGRVSFDASGTVDGGEGAVSEFAIGAGFKSKGPSLSVVGSWPINEMFSIDGRIGAYKGKTKGDLSVSVDAEGEEGVVASDKNTSMLLGVGATWSLTETIGVRLGYTRIQDAVAERDVDRFALGLRFSF